MSAPAPAQPAALAWRIVERDGATVVEMSGEIDENADFADLRDRLQGKVTLDLGAVRRINSFGVREWIDFVRQLPAVTELVLARCSPAIVVQMNMISNFRGPAKVRSIFAPYVCAKCGTEHDELLEVAQLVSGRKLRPLPERVCSSCGGATMLDDQPERYLAFLHDP